MKQSLTSVAITHKKQKSIKPENAKTVQQTKINTIISPFPKLNSFSLTKQTPKCLYSKIDENISSVFYEHFVVFSYRFLKSRECLPATNLIHLFLTYSVLVLQSIPNDSALLESQRPAYYGIPELFRRHREN